MSAHHWALNSPRPLPAAAIEAAMGRELAHWERILDLRLARNNMACLEALAVGRVPEPEQDSPTRRTSHHADMLHQMRACIDAASVVARTMRKLDESRFHVTISGHVGLDTADGSVEERVQVFVDLATLPRDGWPSSKE